MSGLIHVGAWDGHEYIGDKRRLLLVEPQKEAFEKLKQNVGHQENVVLWKVACGSQKTTLPMNTSIPSDNSSLLTPAVPYFFHGGRRIDFEGTELVVVLPLDELTKYRAPYDELIIDTQGYELEVLRGAKETLKQLNKVSLEVHDPEVYPDAATAEEIIGFMFMQKGWKATRIEESPGVCDLVFDRID